MRRKHEQNGIKKQSGSTYVIISYIGQSIRLTDAALPLAGILSAAASTGLICEVLS